MNFPRLLIADERMNEIIPSSAVFINAIKSLGIKVRLFSGGVDERYMKLLSLGCEQEVFSIDPRQMRNESDVKAFFGHLAISDGINFIVSPIGKMVSEDRMEVDSNTLDLSRILQCGVISIIHANPIGVITSKILDGIYRSFRSEGVELYGALLASVLNPREYQLLEIEIGRKIPSVLLGYIPKYMERRGVTLVEMLDDKSSVQPLKNLSSQLKTMKGQIDWASVVAFANYNMSLEVSSLKFEPVSGMPLVAFLEDDSISIGVDNDMAFFKAIGCRVKKVSSKRDVIPPEASMFYVPHGLGYLAMKNLVQNRRLMDQIKNLPRRGRLSFINGGFLPLCGVNYNLLDQGRSLKGLGLLEEKFNYGHPRGNGIPVEIEAIVRREGDMLHFQEREKMRGYLAEYMKENLNRPEKGVCLWSFRSVDNREVLGEAGWQVNRVLASQAKVELWSCPELFKRLLRQKSR